ncbi:neuralized-like protein 4 [Glandiceps talaboti]
MGNELERQQRQQQQDGEAVRLRHTLALLEALGRLAHDDDDDDEPTASPTEIEHAWDPDDCSDNFSVLRDKVTARRGAQSNRTDLIRGKKGYRSGTHSFEIHWPKNERGSHAMIGVADPKAPLSCVGYTYLLGATDDSWGWSLVDKKLIHNGKVIGTYPRGKPKYEVPETIIVILNADDGVLRFRDGVEDLGVAFTNLPHQNLFKPLSISVSSTFGDSDIKMIYKGTVGGISQLTSAGEQIVSVPAPSGGSQYSFHARCGDNAAVMYSGRVAKRNEARESFNNGVVLTKQPLKNNVRFEVRLDTKIARWSGGLEIGFTSNSPLELTFPGTMTECSDGVTLMWSGSNVMKNGETVSQLEIDLDDCTVGDTCGIERKDDGSVHFYFNGKVLNKAVRLRSNPDVAYGVVDVYGQAESVTICESEGESASTGVTKSDMSGSDPNAIMFQMRDTIEYLKGGDVDLRTAIEKIVTIIARPFDETDNEGLRQRFGDHLASLGGGYELTKLLKTVQELGDRRPTDSTWLCTTIIRGICWNYSDSSLKICKQFGQSGLLELVLKDLDRFGPIKITTERRRELIRSAFGVLHNCAKASENKQVFHDIRAIERISPFLRAANMTLAMGAMLTLSYIVDEHKSSLLTATDNLIEYILELLKKTVRSPNLKAISDDNSTFSALELVRGLGNIAVNDKNKAMIVDQGGIPIFVELMKIDRPTEQECAANAIWTLAKLERNKKKIAGVTGCLGTLSSLCKSRNQAVKQAAERALMRLKSTAVQGQVLGTGQALSASRGRCQYRDLCGRFKKSLNLSDVFFNPKFDMCYCTACHEDRGDKLYYARGQPAKDYGVPIGWCRFALKTHPKADALQVFQKWHVAFHGTTINAVNSILNTGDLLMPGDILMGGKQLSELPGHFTPSCKPKGFDTKQIFLSPSIRYSGCDVYAKSSVFKDDVTKKNYEAKVVFQVCINPASYKVGPQTIGATSELDLKFSNQEIEWFTKERGCVIVYGLLVKLE